MPSAVAMRYAKALLEVVTEEKSTVTPSDTLAQLHSISDVIASSHDLHIVLLSPAVPPSRKRAVIDNIAEPLNLAREVRNFLFVVIDHRRVAELSAIVEAFSSILDEHLGFVRADVTSARALTESQQKSLEAELSRLSGKRAKLRFSIDEGLVAGVTARVGSVVYDGSVRGQLERLRVKLAGAGR